MAPPVPVLPTQQEPVLEPAAPTPADAQRILPTPFLTKTYQLVDDPAVDDLVSWNEDGSTFVVWRPAEFARDLLPKYFKHNNFSSFVRQLNTYGFRKIVPDRWEFANDCFRRGEKRLLCDIHRRKIQPPAVATAVPVAVPAHRAASPTNSGDGEVPSPHSSPGATPSTSGLVGGGASLELVEDNYRLRKENERLKQEVSQIRNLCNNILLLMSKYASQQPPPPPLHRPQHQREEASGGGGCTLAAEKRPSATSPLELMPLTRCSGALQPASPDRNYRVNSDDEGGEEDERSPSPRIFGVLIGGKRSRGGEVEPVSDEQPPHRRVAEVKPEPVDPPLEGGAHRWSICHSSCRPPNQGVCN